MRFSQKLFCLLLCAVLTAPLLVSCSDKQNTDGAGTAQTMESESTEPVDTRIYPSLPDADYGSANFVIVNIDYSIPIWAQKDIAVEAENGEIINDAIFKRNTAVEEKYNIKIKSQPELDPGGVITKLVKAGDSSMDMATVALKTFTALAGQGMLVELSKVPHIDLTKPWYDQNSVKNLSIANKLYGVCSDLTIMDNNATTGMVFNKKLATDYSIPNLYELVLDQKWTLDKLIEYTKKVSNDLDGNGTYDDNDRYGLLYQRDTMSSFFSACGGLIASKNEEDLPEMTLINEKEINILNTLYDFLYDEQYCFHVMKYFDPKPEGFTNGMTRMFMENKALFMWIRMADIENLRSMDVDFGIIPNPKYNEAQATYLNTVNPYVGATVVVPQSTPDIERTGLIIEALSAESRYTLQPAYYEVTLTNKYTRDEESPRMLDIIFTTRVYDVGDIFDFNGIASDVIYMTMTYRRDIVTTYEKKATGIQKAIEKVIDEFTSEKQ